ncbi:MULTISPECIES: hypothetical protein [Bacteria]
MTDRNNLEARQAQAQRVTLSAWQGFVAAQRVYLTNELRLQARTTVLQQDDVTDRIADRGALRASADQIMGLLHG